MKISKVVRDAIASRLAAAWAARAATAAGDYALSAKEVERIIGIDWTGARPQFFQGAISMDLLDESTSVVSPVVTLATRGTVQDGAEKFNGWNGSVTVDLAFYLEWPTGRALAQFEETLDLVEDAVTAVLHDRAWLGAIAAEGISYKGEMQSQRSAISADGSNWQQAISFSITYGVDA